MPHLDPENRLCCQVQSIQSKSNKNNYKLGIKWATLNHDFDLEIFFLLEYLVRCFWNISMPHPSFFSPFKKGISRKTWPHPPWMKQKIQDRNFVMESYIDSWSKENLRFKLVHVGDNLLTNSSSSIFWICLILVFCIFLLRSRFDECQPTM